MKQLALGSINIECDEKEVQSVLSIIEKELLSKGIKQLAIVAQNKDNDFGSMLLVLHADDKTDALAMVGALHSLAGEVTNVVHASEYLDNSEVYTLKNINSKALDNGLPTDKDPVH